MSRLDRRQLIQSLSAAPLLAGGRRDIIGDENKRPGTTDWQLTYTKVDPKTKLPLAAHRGLRQPGQRPARREDRLASSAPNPASRVRHRPVPHGLLPAARAAGTSSASGRSPARPSRRRRSARRACASAAGRRRVTLEVPKDWVSGVYLGKLSALDHRYQSYVDLHRPRRPPGRLPLPVQRQHLAGVQRLARQLLALHTTTGPTRSRSSPA